MANQEFTVAQNIRRAPSLRTAHTYKACGLINQEITVAQNIQRAPSSRAIATIKNPLEYLRTISQA